MFGTLAAALITAIGAIVANVVADDPDSGPVIESAAGAIESFTSGAGGTELRVEGSAEDASVVYVIAGPMPGGGYWATEADVGEDGHWAATLKLDPPPVPDEVELKAVFEGSELDDSDDSSDDFSSDFSDVFSSDFSDDFSDDVETLDDCLELRGADCFVDEEVLSTDVDLTG